MKETISIKICTDCAIWCANGDDSGMDEATAQRVKEAERAQGERGYSVALGDEVVEFSMSRCDLCRSPLGGTRHEAYLLER